MTDQTLPKQELLVKLLKLTTSDNDSECLIAIRKANTLLTSSGWDWDKLISSKIVIVEDPFGAIKDPRPAAPSMTPRYGTPQTRNPAGPVLPPHWRATPSTPISSIPNKYPGFCYCCGKEIIATSGFTFKPNAFVNTTIDNFRVVCTPCNTSGVVRTSAALRVMNPRKKTVSDLA